MGTNEFHKMVDAARIVYPCGCVKHWEKNITHCPRHEWSERGALRNKDENPAEEEYNVKATNV